MVVGGQVTCLQESDVVVGGQATCVWNSEMVAERQVTCLRKSETVAERQVTCLWKSETVAERQVTCPESRTARSACVLCRARGVADVELQHQARPGRSPAVRFASARLRVRRVRPPRRAAAKTGALAPREREGDPSAPQASAEARPVGASAQAPAPHHPKATPRAPPCADPRQTPARCFT